MILPGGQHDNCLTLLYRLELAIRISFNTVDTDNWKY